MTKSKPSFTPKPPDPRIEELNEKIADIMAEALTRYIFRKGLLKRKNTADVLARIEELKESRPDYDKL